LMERINNRETMYEIKEKNAEITMIINQIKNDIDILKQDIYTFQDGFEWENIDKIEKEINIFYENMQRQKTAHQ